ncbi:unnamed protein product [Peronospora belbahrii]|uniref:Kazal-like domain-containing protein n=1 Tax=Peronospora belbahrii TaxID=622444 RepID=A0AAU9KM90_9STRA|nr:unnamed protein product [Peronospora belbahrii]
MAPKTICKQTVKFQRRCGHFEMVRCERAFELAQSPSRGQEQVVLTNPECGHEYSTTCFEGKRLQDKVAQWSKKMEDVDPLEICKRVILASIVIASSISNAVVKWCTFVPVVTRQI